VYPSLIQLWLKTVILEEAPPEMLGIYIDGKLSTHSHIFRFDVAVPAVNLAIEYQGKQHYTDLFDAGGLNSQRERDDMRRKLCEEHGVTLIRVCIHSLLERISMNLIFTVISGSLLVG